MSVVLSVFLAAVVAHVLTWAYYNRRRNSRSLLGQLQGPKSPSFWIGNEGDLFYQNEVGDSEFEWMRRFGSAWRRRGCLGEDHLMVADPKALHYILHTSSYNFPKRRDLLKATEMIVGEGALFCANGKVHERQKKIMAPAFFASNLNAFFSMFQDSASKLVQKWKDELVTPDPSGKPLVNVTGWLSRTALDIIGQAGFDFHFGSLDNAETELAKMYANLFIDTTLHPTPMNLIFKSTWRYVPEFLLHFVRYLPTREYRRFRTYLDYVREFSENIVKNAAKGEGNDMISVLLRTNASEEPKNRLKHREIVDQLSALMLAGHETTASSLAWFLWEIARHPESQERIREEISAVYSRRADGEDLSIADLDRMTYMQAALKESLRLHPIIWIFAREAGRDEVIPLAFPVTTKSGEQVSSIPVKRGTKIDIAVDAYQRLPQVWGEDADEWNPDRFSNTEAVKQVSIGLYGNLLNFSGGPQGCIGWRFAVLEMLVIIATLVKHFEFSLPADDEKKGTRGRICRKPCAVMMPMAEGEIGAWMGLVIKSVD